MNTFTLRLPWRHISIKSTKLKVNFLIVGQGIAGTFLAKTLLDKGQKVVVVDMYNPGTPSRIAGGAFNPLVFKRITKTWMADEIIPVMEEQVKDIESTTGTSFLNHYPLHKIFSGEPDIQFWQERIEKVGIQKYADKYPSRDIKDPMINTPYGTGKVKGAGRVLLKPLLGAFRAHLMEQDSLMEAPFEHDALNMLESGYEWNGIHAEHIVFCEGPAIANNPHFKFIPMKSTKGEVLTIKFTNDFPEIMINKRATIIPQHNGLYKFGATYDWSELNTEPTRDAELELKLKLKNITRKSYEIVEHKASVRPTTIDRRPAVGMHPKHKNMWILNGLGSKGIMLGPYFAKALTDYILDSKKLHPEADVQRFV